MSPEGQIASCPFASRQRMSESPVAVEVADPLDLPEQARVRPSGVALTEPDSRRHVPDGDLAGRLPPEDVAHVIAVEVARALDVPIGIEPERQLADHRGTVHEPFEDAAVGVPPEHVRARAAAIRGVGRDEAVVAQEEHAELVAAGPDSAQTLGVARRVVRAEPHPALARKGGIGERSHRAAWLVVVSPLAERSAERVACQELRHPARVPYQWLRASDRACVRPSRGARERDPVGTRPERRRHSGDVVAHAEPARDQCQDLPAGNSVALRSRSNASWAPGS